MIIRMKPLPSPPGWIVNSNLLVAQQTKINSDSISWVHLCASYGIFEVQSPQASIAITIDVGRVFSVKICETCGKQAVCDNYMAIKY